MTVIPGDELEERGFVVIPGPVPPDRFARLVSAYDDAMASAAGDDIRVGSASTRVTDLVNRGAAFDDLYLFPPLLDAARQVIGRPFKLSSLHARTVRPHSPAREQDLHVDVRRETADWPLLAFILMIDEFRPDNGATRFVPGSHRWASTPDRGHEEQLGCGAAGSLLVFNGSIWHEHGRNVTSGPRRSIQGAFIPRDGRAATDFGARMAPETRARLGEVALDVLAL